MEFFRQPTEEEKKDFIPLTEKKENKFEEFKRMLNIEQQKYTKLRKPFCFRCARLDFKEQLDEQIKQLERKKGYVDLREIKVTFPDLKQYSDPDRFEFIKESDAMEPLSRIQAGTVQRQIKIGVHKDYKCKIGNCGISIFIPNDEIEKMPEMSEQKPKKP